MRHRPLRLAVLLLAGCGSPAAPASAGGEPVSSTSPSATSGPAAGYTAHEWGLVDYVLSSGSFELAAGPGRPGAALPDVPRPMQTRKPVIYFHLAQPESLRVDVTVRLGTGAFAEHWPPASVSARELRWDAVELTPGPCRAPLEAPARESPACRDAPDGYCELADLGAYRAPEAVCARHDGRNVPFLFYRGTGERGRLPLVVAPHGDGVRVRNESLAGARGPLLRLIRDGESTRAWVGTLPGPSEAVDVPRASSVEAVPNARAALSGALRGLGLEEGEARAFERAWFAELFENGASGGAPVVRDALIFFLPREAIDELARLELSPPPRAVVRVMAMRVDLGG